MTTTANRCEVLNEVQHNKILVETILKEEKTQKLYTNYSINPYKKMYTITGKPNSFHNTEEGEEDSHFRTVIERSNQEPTKKYLFPQTESQEYGWISQPLIDYDRSDERLYFPCKRSPITKYMEAVFRDKEQTDTN